MLQRSYSNNISTVFVISAQIVLIDRVLEMCNISRVIGRKVSKCLVRVQWLGGS